MHSMYSYICELADTIIRMYTCIYLEMQLLPLEHLCTLKWETCGGAFRIQLFAQCTSVILCIYIEFPVELFPAIFSNNDVVTLHQHYNIVQVLKLFIDCEYS